MRIIACMPSYKIMDVLAVRSLIAFQADLYSEGHTLHIVFTNGYTASAGRNQMFKWAAKEEADYVLSLDSDHIYSASVMHDLIKKLEENKLQLLSAKYYARSDFRPNVRTVAMGSYDKDGKFKLRVPEPEEKGLVDVDVVGLGFCVLRHSFVKDMVAKHDNLFHIDKKGNYADDVVFCSFVKEEGHRICYDADNIIGHISVMVNK